MRRQTAICENGECKRKVVPIRDGHWTSWGGKWNPTKFFCLTCLKKMEKAEADARNAAILAERRSWLEEALKQPTFKERENRAMIEVLRELCPNAGWYALKDITKKYREKHAACDPRALSHILRRLGFVKRARKKRGSYMYVYVDPIMIPDKAAPLH